LLAEKLILETLEQGVWGSNWPHGSSDVLTEERLDDASTLDLFENS
jgi:hypothetical protein